MRGKSIIRRLKEKVAVIAGIGSGVGRATAILFAKEGAKIIGADVDRGKGLGSDGND